MPIFPFLCHECFYEVDLILGHDEVEGQMCPRCQEGHMSRLASAPAAPRGDFGTTRRNIKGQASQQFNFHKEAPRDPDQLELPLTKKVE